MTADTIATPTQPKTQMKSVATSASLDPPTMPWAMIQSQARSPSARSAMRNAAGGMRPVSRGLLAHRPDVADQHEDERQGDGRGGTREVDRQRQPARVGRVERVREDGGRCAEGDRSDDRETGGQPVRGAVRSRAVRGAAASREQEPRRDEDDGERRDDRQDHVAVAGACGSDGPGDADGLVAAVGLGSGVAPGVGSALVVDPRRGRAARASATGGRRR